MVRPRHEGADSHAIGTNVNPMSQVVFDWLDEVLGDQGQPSSVSDPSMEAPAHAATLVR